MASLADIRARLTAQETRSTPTQRTQDNAIYPHWNIDEGATAVVRFLPDGDSNNGFFWIERQIIKLPFVGIKGDNNSKRTEVQVPCVEMWGESCPILAEVRPWYKDESLKEMANRYWKKRSYLFQGFVRTNPLAEDKTPDNPIRRFVISSQIFNVIKSSLMDTEIEELPTDFQRGLDFRIAKTQKGGYADYSTSSWARKESSLTEAELAAIEAYGLYNLADFLPKRPGEVELKVMKEMFEASVDGQPYDPDRWAAYYKPYGLQVEGNAKPDSDSDIEASPLVVKSSAPAQDDAPFTPNVPAAAPPSTAASSDRAQDILAMIRNRQNKAA